MGKIQKRNIDSPKSDLSELKELRNPIAKDLKTMVEKVIHLVSLFGSSHIVLPKNLQESIIGILQKYGYRVESLKIEDNPLFKPNQIKKLVFFKVSKSENESHN